MKLLLMLSLLCQALFAHMLMAAGETSRVRVADPYLEMHTGPGRGFPVFHVVEKGASIDVLKRKTEWFRVRTENGREGWVPREQMALTLTATGERITISEAQRSDFDRRRWEAGLLGGDFAGANVISLHGGYAFTDNLAGEMSLAWVLGDYSSSLIAGISLLNQPFPSWRVSPYFALGLGAMRTEPRVTLVKAEQDTNAQANAGLGVRAYITRRFIFRAEYRNYVVFSGDNDNEEIEEWKAGFAAFF